MPDPTTYNNLKDKIGQLEVQLHDVLALLESLSIENSVLKERESKLLHERADLHNRNDKVRSQVETMIQRLKTLDHNNN